MVMDETRNKNLNPVFFVEKAQELFRILNNSIFKDKNKAEEFIKSFDIIVDTLIAQMKESGTVYTKETILLFGSSLGEAFCIVFNGNWKYSEKQQRWIISCNTKDGDPAELNVFHKLEKRIENGMEDSISYYFDVNKKLLLGELNL